MRKHTLFAVALLATCPNVAQAQVDPDWSRREMERMQAEQERFNAQVERQRAQQERWQEQFERQQAEQARDAAVQSGESGCALCNIISIFDGLSTKRHSKAAGRMLASGDCSGAERYALSKGDFDLVSEVKDYCGRQGSRDVRPASATKWLKVESDPDGTTYFVDTQSIRQEGDRLAWWMHAIYPAASEKRQISIMSFYRCLDHRNAVKTFVSYLRDGNVQFHTIPDRDLKFDSLDLKTPSERAMVAAG